MKVELTIKGNKYPFDNEDLWFRTEFQFDTGIAVEDVLTLPEAALEKVLIKLCYWGLKNGARKNKVRFPFTYDGFLEVITEDSGIMDEYMKHLTGELEKVAKGEDEKKKKAPTKK